MSGDVSREFTGRSELAAGVSPDTEERPELCFALCLDTNFVPGAAGTIRSIRKFYGPDEADIVVFVDRDFENFPDFCARHGAELRYFSEIEGWVLPLVYDDPRYAEDASHYYHPAFRPPQGLNLSVDRTPGFHTIRHLHPLNVKAYCTGYCLCVKNYRRVVHIDSDAFLLARVDEVFERHPEPDTVVAFDDGDEHLPHLEALYGVPKPSGFDPSAYGFNAGVVFYGNGPGVKELARDFMFYVESCCHYSHSGHFADQGVLRALVAKHHLNGGIRYHREAAPNWNPTWFRADDLDFDEAARAWRNRRTGEVQRVWHGAGGEKLWTGRYPSPSVNAAWRWAGGSYGSGWARELRRSQGGEAPWYERVLADGDYNPKLCFTTCLNRDYMLGAMGTIRSIRKFYGPDEADIVVFVDRDFENFPDFCARHGAELRYFSEIEGWVLPLVYDDPRYAEDASHYYHPAWRPLPHLPAHGERSGAPGFHTIRHLHPLNVKAYCTGYCLCVKNYRRVVHIDSDAFLLARVDEVFDEHGGENTVIAFDDDEDLLPNLEALFGVRRPANFYGARYGFNAGVVFYGNGPGVKELARDFMFYVESCYHYTYAGTFADQGLLRALVAKHEILGNVRFVLKDGTNWNPTWRRADSLEYQAKTGEWLNLRNGQRQRLWHAPSKERLWTGEHASPSVNAAWRWVGGTYEGATWQQVPGPLRGDTVEFVAATVADYLRAAPGGFPARPVEILEIGTHHARTAVAFVQLLRERGFEARLDTCDIYAPTSDYPSEGDVTFEQARRHVTRAGLGDRITLHHVGPNENLVARFAERRFDFVYVDACHEYKQVVADCHTALHLVADRGIVIGDDFNLPDVRDAVFDFFGRGGVRAERDQWIVCVEPAGAPVACNPEPAQQQPGTPG